MSGTQDPQIEVKLTMAQWDGVLRMLAEQPFRISAGLIGDIQRQLQVATSRDTERPRLVPGDYGPVRDVAS